MTEWFEKVTYYQALDRAAARFGERTALTFGRRSWTFRELRDEVDGVAWGLIQSGVGQGDVVALWMLNRPEWIFTLFAVTRIGAVVLPVNTALRTEDCRYILEHSECSTLVLAPQSGPVSYIDMVNAMAPDLPRQDPALLKLERFPRLRRIISLSAEVTPSGCLEWSNLVTHDPEARRALPPAASDPDALATVMYTSGTTGAPKGVMHSHHAIRNVVDEANRLNVRESDVILMFLPLFHAYGLYEGPLLSIVTGARCVLLERFDAGQALKTLAEEHASLCFGFSTHFHDLMSHPDFPGTERSSLRAGIVAVGPRSMESLALKVQREFGGKVVSGYGMTEIGVGATLGFLDEDEVHSCSTSGYPLPGYEFRVLDRQSGRDCVRGESGEVLVRTYQMMLGYLKEPEKTAASLDSDGWLHTGDVGVMQEDGYLRIIGRFKDMLRVAGENVDPAEVEALYNSHPAVVAVVVVGVPDTRLDEVPCLCVKLGDGLVLDEALHAELLRFADGRLAAFKRPRYVIRFEDFPMTASGKIARADIQAAASRRSGGPVEA